MTKYQLIYLLLISLLGLSPVLAQETASIKGIVTDPNGAAVAGAKVTVSNSVTKQTSEAVTDAQGQYTLANLAPGKYAVVVSAKNFQQVTKEVTASEDTSLNVKLSVRAVAEKVEVTDSKSYLVEVAATATKTDTPLRETPVSVQVVPRSVIDETQAQRVEDAVKYVSGVTAEQGFGNSIDQFTLRGFRTFRILREGLQINSDITLNGPRDLANIEQVEVLKGPAAMLFGRLDPGGVINLITKKPLPTQHGSVDLTLGSYGFRRVEADLTGPFGRTSKLGYRLNAAFEASDSFRDFTESNRTFVSPVISWQAERTTVTGEFEYLNGFNNLDWGIPSLNGRPAPTTRSFFAGEPKSSRNEYQDLLAGGYVSHRFDREFTLRGKINYQRTVISFDSMFPLGLAADNRTLTRFPSAQRERTTNAYFASLDASKRFRTGKVKHTWLVGGEYYNTRTIGHAFSGTTFPTIDIFAPVYGASFVYGPETRQNLDNDWSGLYAQDQIELPGRVFVLAGLRYDDATSRAADVRTGVLLSSRKTKDKSVSPRIGVLWQAHNALGLYANYVQGLGRQNVGNITAAGEPLDPEKGRQYEAGAKLGLFNKSLLVNAALFRIYRQNITTTDPRNPTFAITTGEARNTGFELDITGSPVKGVEVIAAYASIDSEITRDTNQSILGNRFPNVPRHNGSLFIVKRFLTSDEGGLSVGVGGVARSSSRADLRNSIRLPGYATMDLFARYDFKVSGIGLSAQLNANNALDKTYYPSAAANNGITVGKPATIFGSIKVRF